MHGKPHSAPSLSGFCISSEIAEIAKDHGIRVSPAGLCSIPAGAKYLGLSAPKMRRLAKEDDRFTVVTIGDRVLLRIEGLVRVAKGEAI